LRKFFYAPGIAQETWGDFVYIGSGDREDPPKTAVVDRFYAIRNTWSGARDDDNPIKDTDLIDITADELQGNSLTNEQKAQLRQDLSISGYGWYINMENSGEKIVSTPLVYNKVIYFTTYSPAATAPSAEDLCSTGTGSGTGRLYAINYLSGEAVYPGFYATGSTGGSGVAVKADRSTLLGSGIPSEPTLVITEHGTFVIVGTEKGTTSFNTNDPRSMNRYFWLKQ
jgi:type IV pilus assembly protein PilY1